MDFPFARTSPAAPAFEHPKISVNANINAGFADRIGGRMMEAQGKRAVIDARPAKADQRQKSLNRFGDGQLLLYAAMALCPDGLGDHHQGE